VLTVVKAALPELLKNKGAVVNISSFLGKVPIWGYAPYCAAKAAQDMCVWVGGRIGVAWLGTIAAGWLGFGIWG
jgi:NAD(P)-dependent dehydrogenase (short-subunit alcohol dehydrogenase family)